MVGSFQGILCILFHSNISEDKGFGSNLGTIRSKRSSVFFGGPVVEALAVKPPKEVGRTSNPLPTLGPAVTGPGTSAFAAEARHEVASLTSRLAAALGETKAARRAAKAAGAGGHADPDGCASSQEIQWWASSNPELAAAAVGPRSLRVLNWNLWNLQEQVGLPPHMLL